MKTRFSQPSECIVSQSTGSILETCTQKEHVNDPEVSEVLGLLDEAAQANLAVVSVLEPPADLERSRRVTCPFDEPEKLPIPWGNLAATLKRLSKPR